MIKDSDLPAFVKVWQAPKAIFKGCTLFKLSPRGLWLYERSKQRYLQRPDAREIPVHACELGQYENFRFIPCLPLDN